ncbi:beta-lactamase hydrolase domain-containing protein [Aerolutibacter daejeonensis]|uniref:beta-lactamase hydrolase domain-containing protein n=1 Tax=Aerolutibacter daejeonensis TaxID=346181 RepID=UPI000A05872D|nr:sulfur transferase domain-containing protein [Lysobacter daejeonensis]
MNHRNDIRLVAAGLLAATLAVACASAPEATSSASTTPTSVVERQAVAGPDIAGLRQPRPGLYTGGQPAAETWAAMAAAGVGTVINLRPDAELAGRDEAAEVRAAGMAYHQIPVAGADGITAENADRLWALLKDAKGPVVVHCASGNRVGGLLSVALVRHGALQPEAALALGREAGMVSTEAKAKAVLSSDEGRCVSDC